MADAYPWRADVKASDANSMNGLRILVVDDHYVVRRGLTQILAEHIQPIHFGEAADGADAVHQVWNSPWDLVLLDINLPGRGGLDALKEMKQAKPKLPVIVVSMMDEDQFALRVLKLGAFAYIRKDSAGTDLIAAVQAALNGQPYITPTIRAKLALHLQSDRNRQPHESLSDREYQVFCLIGSGLSVKEVADRLSLSVKTVSTYRCRALQSTGLKNNAQIIHYVVRHQLSVAEPELVH
jgi:DNA-binding NarL/FixJ family response regulator